MNVGKRFTLGKMKNELKNGRGVGNLAFGREQGGRGKREKICGVLECGMSGMISPTLIFLFYAFWLTNNEWK